MPYPIIPVDFENRPMAPGDDVIFVTGMGSLRRVTITKYFEKSGKITVEADEAVREWDDELEKYVTVRTYRRKFATNYHKSKFYKEK